MHIVTPPTSPPGSSSQSRHVSRPRDGRAVDEAEHGTQGVAITKAAHRRRHGKSTRFALLFFLFFLFRLGGGRGGGGTRGIGSSQRFRLGGGRGRVALEGWGLLSAMGTHSLRGMSCLLNIPSSALQTCALQTSALQTSDLQTSALLPLSELALSKLALSTLPASGIIRLQHFVIAYC